MDMMILPLMVSIARDELREPTHRMARVNRMCRVSNRNAKRPHYRKLAWSARPKVRKELRERARALELYLYLAGCKSPTIRRRVEA